MTKLLFSSGKHERLIDPEPILRRHDRGTGNWNPRARPLTNPAKPILAEFRDAMGSDLYEQAAQAAWWVELLSDALGETKRGQAGLISGVALARFDGFDLDGLTLGHIKHARRVLARLANITKEN